MEEPLHNQNNSNRNDQIFCPTEAQQNNPVNKIVIYICFNNQSYPYDFQHLSIQKKLIVNEL